MLSTVRYNIKLQTNIDRMFAHTWVRFLALAQIDELVYLTTLSLNKLIYISNPKLGIELAMGLLSLYMTILRNMG